VVPPTLAPESRPETHHHAPSSRRCNARFKPPLSHLRLHPICERSFFLSLSLPSWKLPLRLTHPQCFRRYFIHNILYLAGAFLSIVAAISATGYSAHIYATTGAGNNSNSRDTIQSWTCRWYDGANAHSTTSAGGIKAPTGFGRLCSESHAAFDITIAAILFELAALALGGVGFWLEKKMRGGGGRDLGQRGGED